jgi:hypothetical protein
MMLRSVTLRTLHGKKEVWVYRGFSLEWLQDTFEVDEDTPESVLRISQGKGKSKELNHSRKDSFQTNTFQIYVRLLIYTESGTKRIVYIGGLYR